MLLEKFRDKYFKNINCQVMRLDKLCAKMEIEFDWNQPRDLISRVITKLSESDDVTTILMVDELFPCRVEGQTTPDWSDVTTADNVVWILSVRPSSSSDETINLSPPVSDKVLSTKLVRGYRNCLEIRSVVIS